MNGRQVTLTDGSVVNVQIGSGIKEVQAKRHGEKITLKKRTTTIKITEGEEGNEQVICEKTVSCSHLDEFSKTAGRKAAWKHLTGGSEVYEVNGQRVLKIIEPDVAFKPGGRLANKQDRVRIVDALNVTEETPKVKDKEAIKAQKAAMKLKKEAKAKKEKAGT